VSSVPIQGNAHASIEWELSSMWFASPQLLAISRYSHERTVHVAASGWLHSSTETAYTRAGCVVEWQRNSTDGLDGERRGCNHCATGYNRESPKKHDRRHLCTVPLPRLALRRCGADASDVLLLAPQLQRSVPIIPSSPFGKPLGYAPIL
jgi:hypothetical protein